MTKRWLLGLLVAALMFAVTGCSAVEDKIGEEVGEEIAGAAIGGDVEVEDDSVTVSGDDGDVTITGGGSEMPADFPEEFPLYKDADLDSASSIAGGDGTSFYLNLVSKDSADKVYDSVKADFTDDGWEIVSDMKTTADDGTTAIISVKKGDIDGSVTIGTSDGGSDIGVIVTTK